MPNLVLQDKQIETQNKILEKQLQYFKTKTQSTSNDMVKALNNLTQVDNGLHTRCCQQQAMYTKCYKKSFGRMKVINHHTT
jgi:hypothetical protein